VSRSCITSLSTWDFEEKLVKTLPTETPARRAMTRMVASS